MQAGLVSIIAPVYNVEQYLKQCIDSVISQTYTNWEFILVNDCSPDNSQEIIDEYAKKDSRIKSFKTQQNLCSGGARNIGLDNARGEYIMFLDPDDWILENTLKDCIDSFSANIDCVVFGTNMHYDDTPFMDYPVYKFTNGVHKLTSQNILKMHSSPWGKMHKADKIKHLRFPEFMPMAQDVAFNISYFWLEMPQIFYIQKPLYQYRQRTNSAVIARNKNGYCVLQSILIGLDFILQNDAAKITLLRKSFLDYIYDHMEFNMPKLDSTAQEKWCLISKDIFSKLNLTAQEKQRLGIYYDMSTTYDADVKDRMYKKGRPFIRALKDTIKPITMQMRIFKYIHFVYRKFQEYKESVTNFIRHHEA